MYIHLSADFAVRLEPEASFLIQLSHVLGKGNWSFEAFNIPSFMGYILAHIGDYEKNESIEYLSSKMGVSSESIDRFVNQLIENPEGKSFNLNRDYSIILPPNLLTQSKSKTAVNVWEAANFNVNADFKICRPQMPISANLMITTQCTTDCVYCYANRSIKPLMSTDTILKLIDQLYEEGLVNLTMTGGDIFAHKDWLQILSRFRKYGYFPYLSTKTPLDELSLIELKNLGYDEIQFSLDSNNEKILNNLINAPIGYIDKVKNFFANAEKHNIKILTRTVLTNINSEIALIEDFYNFLSSYSSVKEWVMTPAFFSQYKSAKYHYLEVGNENLKEIYKFAKQDGLKFPVLLNKITEDGYKLKSTQNVNEFVDKNQICLANTTSISILANGKCNICEMLYETDDYVIGDIYKNSIRDIWNSPKALKLYNLKQQHIQHCSPCANCSVLAKCRQGFGKRVCYVDIQKAGNQLSFPDPRCPMSEDYNLIF